VVINTSSSSKSRFGKKGGVASYGDVEARRPALNATDLCSLGVSCSPALRKGPLFSKYWVTYFWNLKYFAS